jgi:hypothetical protein
MIFRKILTWPGDVALRFLVWREDMISQNELVETMGYFMLWPIACAAHAIMVTADCIDDFFDNWGKNSLNK